MNAVCVSTLDNRVIDSGRWSNRRIRGGLAARGEPPPSPIILQSTVSMSRPVFSARRIRWSASHLLNLTSPRAGAKKANPIARMAQSRPISTPEVPSTVPFQHIVRRSPESHARCTSSFHIPIPFIVTWTSNSIFRRPRRFSAIRSKMWRCVFFADITPVAVNCYLIRPRASHSSACVR